jgi:small-conductance mechanosensitive channel
MSALSTFGVTLTTWNPITETLLVVVVVTVIYLGLARITRRIREARYRITASRILASVLVLAALLVIGGIWIQNGTLFLAFAGLVSAGLAFSLRDPITSLIGWFVIVGLRPFQLGDRIQIGTIGGDVVGFNAFYFSLMEIGQWTPGDLYTGRLVEVPNNQIMRQALYNYSRNFDFLWDTIIVGVYFSAPWRTAGEIATRIAQEETGPILAEGQAELDQFRERYYLRLGRVEPTVFYSIAANTVNVQLRYITRVWERTVTRSRITDRILTEMARAGISIAYPSVVVRDPGPEDHPPIPPSG